MKKLFSCLLLSSNLMAATGVIRALEVPLLLEEKDDSTILQKIRMGQKIHINDNTLDTESEYYQTLTRDGMNAYIKKSFVKMIYRSEREYSEKIHLAEDPTDYRLEEPMPDAYPFKDVLNNKASMYLNYQNSTESSYDYSGDRTREVYNPTYTLSLKYMRNPKFDYTNRVYYGLYFGGQTEENDFQIGSNVFAAERHIKFFLGPTFQYTFYRRRFFEIDLSVDLAFNFQRTFVKQEDTSNNTAEELEFTGYFLSSKANVLFVHKDPFNTRHFDIFHGPNISVNMPYTLTSSTPIQLDNFFNKTSYQVSSEISLGYYLGFTLRY